MRRSRAHQVISALFSSQEPCCVSCSPTGYRFGFGSPTRLVRFGLAGATTVSGSGGRDGVLPFDASASAAGSAVFFLRPRAGFGATSVVGSDAWITLAGSGSCGVASTFLRDLVFLTFGCSASGRGATSPEGVDPLLVSSSCGAGTGEPFGSGEVSRGGRGGIGAISSPPCKIRHRCSRLLSVCSSFCSPSEASRAICRKISVGRI